MKETHRRVRFRGQEYWHHKDLLSPIDHYTEEGEFIAYPIRDISFAVIVNTRIVRYGFVIGDTSELEAIEG